MVAFVGSEASGKSTTVSQIGQWLSEYLDVRICHAGKPPSTWLTFIPRLFLPLLRKRLPHMRTNTITESDSSQATAKSRDRDKPPSLIFMARSVMVAFDQLHALQRAFRQANRGAFVICDRYPSAVLGGMDGPRLDPAAFPNDPIRRRLAELETRIYAAVPRPDLVFRLDVPLELAVWRNATRHKPGEPEDEAYVRRRYVLVSKWAIPNARVEHIDTTRPLEETLLKIKRAVWQLA